MSSTKKKSLLNILFGILGQIITIAVGLLLPRLFITSYGSETNGFLSSVNDIVIYLALLEAGVGTATIQALYGPIGRGDRNKINGIMAATDKFYKRTAILYAAGVLLLAVGYPLIVKSELNSFLQAGVILLVGGSGALGYYFTAKYRRLLSAEGKEYVPANVTTIAHLAISIIKIIMISCGLSILWLQVAQLFVTIVQIGYYGWYMRRHYGWLDLKVKPDEAAISQKKNVLVHQVAQMVFNHTDVLILTLFTNLKIVSVYVLYNTLMDMVSTLISNANTGFTYRLGQLCNTDRKRFLRVFDTYETFYMAISFALYCVTYLFILPFMRLYTRGVTDVNYLLTYLPILFLVYKVMVCGRAACGAVINYAGHFKKTQWRAVLETGINLVVSIVAVVLLHNFRDSGIYGVLLGTIAALLYRANDMIIYANRHILERSCWQTYRKWALNIILFVLCVTMWRLIPRSVALLDGYFNLVLWAAIATVAIVVAFLGVNALAYRGAAKGVWGYIKEELLPKKRIKRGA